MSFAQSARGGVALEAKPRPDITTMRIVIGMLRLAERDYLAPHTAASVRLSAYTVLFGQDSPLRTICLLLHIDHYAAQMHILIWKLQGRIGDPVFGFLSKPDNVDRMEDGETIAMPNFANLGAAIAASAIGRAG